MRVQNSWITRLETTSESHVNHLPEGTIFIQCRFLQQARTRGGWPCVIIHVKFLRSHPLTSILAPFSYPNPTTPNTVVNSSPFANNGRNVLRIIDGFQQPRSTRLVEVQDDTYQNMNRLVPNCSVAYTLSYLPNDVSGVLKP